MSQTFCMHLACVVHVYTYINSTLKKINLPTCLLFPTHREMFLPALKVSLPMQIQYRCQLYLLFDLKIPEGIFQLLSFSNTSCEVRGCFLPLDNTGKRVKGCYAECTAPYLSNIKKNT